MARSSIIAWSLALIGLGFSVLVITLDAVNAHRFAPPIVGLLVASGFLLVGLVLATRRPHNPIGWLYLVAMTLITFGGAGDVSDQYATYALVTRPGELPAPEWVAWAGEVARTTAFFALLIFSLLLLPDGRLRSRRWRLVAIAGGVGLAGLTLRNAFLPHELSAPVAIANPAAIALPDVVPNLFSVSSLLLVGVLIAAFGSLLLRFRDARGIERQQLKWFAYGAVWIPVVAALGVAAAIIAPTLDVGFWNALFPLSVAGIPLATGIAILRYRLYDIDVLINRTLVYGATTATIGATFFGGIVVLQTILRSFTSGSELAVAASTLASVGLFQPLLRRVQTAVDRRFYRTRYDAARTLDAFSVRLRDEVDLDAVRADLIDAVVVTVQPAHASFWLRR